MDFHEYANLFPMLDDVELGELADDIRNNGLHDEIVLYDGQILDGRNRYLACREANVQPRFEQYNGNDPLGFVVSKNLHRRHLTSSQRAVIALDALPALEEQARERQVELAGTRPNTGNDLVEKIPEGDKGRAREQAAQMFGTNPRYVSDAKKIAEEAPELIPEIRAGKLTVNKAKRMAKAAADEDKIQRGVFPVINGKFHTIVIDPPWEYDLNLIGRTRPEYAVMGIDSIQDMDLGQWADDDCHLYVWVTNAMIPKACRLIEAWGFEYKTLITWVKPSIGMGAYFRNDTEHVMFARRGKLSTRAKDIGTHFEAPRGKHSEKPDAFYDIVMRASYPPYLDIFARKQRDGWDVWGNIHDNG